MEKSVLTILLLIGGLICVAYMINGLYPVVNRGSDAVSAMTDAVGDRIRSDVTIIHAVTEYDDGGWEDVNFNGWFDIYAWAKNIGLTRIDDIEGCDLFFGKEGDFHRYSHWNYASGTPNWIYSFEGGATSWSPQDTIKITLRYHNAYAGSGLTNNTNYKLKLIIPNGISDEILLSW